MYTEFCRTAKFWINYPISRVSLHKQIRNLGRRRGDIHPCPVCNNDKCTKVKFVFEGKRIIKYMCLQCNHIFSLWLNSDLTKAQELFNYEEENPWKDSEKHLLLQVVKYANRKGKYLDFGVGSNINAVKELNNNKLKSVVFFACDLNERNEANYFVTYRNNNMIGVFDGIASSNVVEYLDNTLEAWKYFNKLLKPMKAGGGVMVHSFPSQLHYDLSHWGMQINSHLCLFSKASLKLVCKKSGFNWLKWKWSGKLRFPMFFFRKTKDV